jgi:hypothetical protein
LLVLVLLLLAGALSRGGVGGDGPAPGVVGREVERVFFEPKPVTSSADDAFGVRAPKAPLLLLLLAGTFDLGGGGHTPLFRPAPVTLSADDAFGVRAPTVL